LVVIINNVNPVRSNLTVWCFPCLVIVIHARKVFPIHSSLTREGKTFLAFMTMTWQGKHNTWGPSHRIVTLLSLFAIKIFGTNFSVTFYRVSNYLNPDKIIFSTFYHDVAKNKIGNTPGAKNCKMLQKFWFFCRFSIKCKEIVFLLLSLRSDKSLKCIFSKKVLNSNFSNVHK